MQQERSMTSGELNMPKEKDLPLFDNKLDPDLGRG